MMRPPLVNVYLPRLTHNLPTIISGFIKRLLAWLKPNGIKTKRQRLV